MRNKPLTLKLDRLGQIAVEQYEKPGIYRLSYNPDDMRTERKPEAELEEFLAPDAAKKYIGEKE